MLVSSASIFVSLCIQIVCLGHPTNALNLDQSSRRGFIRTASSVTTGIVGGTTLLSPLPALSAPGRGKIVCVTGANGYIGLHTVSQLLQSGYTVRAAIRSQTEEKTKWLAKVAYDAGAADRLSFATINLLDVSSMINAARGCDSLVHLASPYSLNSSGDPIKTILVPAVAGATNAVLAADSLGLRKLVTCGSVFGMVGSGREKGFDHVYGSNDVNSFNTPRGCTYAYSKREAQQKSAALASDRGVDLVTLNVGQVCGPALSPDQINPSWESVRILANPQQGGATLSCVLPGFVDVRDVAAAHVAALSLGPTAPRRYPIAARMESPTNAEIAALMSEILPERNLPAQVGVLPPAVQKLVTKAIGLGNKSLGELLESVAVPEGKTLLIDVEPMLKDLVPNPREIKTTLNDWIINQKEYSHSV